MSKNFEQNVLANVERIGDEVRHTIEAVNESDERFGFVMLCGSLEREAMWPMVTNLKLETVRRLCAAQIEAIDAILQSRSN